MTRACYAAAAGLVLTTSGLAGSASTAKARPTAPAASFTVPGVLYAVAANSATNAWAVGQARGGGTLIARWNGTAWRRVSSPRTAGGGILYSMAVTSARNAWAVGQAGGHSTLILRWNGTAWKRMPSPAPAKGTLRAVSATSATNAWAVGWTSGGSTLILRWNGTAWKRVPSPTAKGYVTQLWGVAAMSVSNAWAVGAIDTSGGVDVILRWNGTAWKQVPAGSPPATCGDYVFGVAATSAANAWAVGTRNTCAFGQTYVQQWKKWKGKIFSWLWVPTPSPDVSWLYGVAATSASNAWAVGVLGDVGALTKTIILRWNGTAWTQVPSPHPAGGSTLFGVAATSAGNAWAVGVAGCCGGPYKTLIVRWNGTAWK